MIIKHRIVPYLKNRNIFHDTTTFEKFLKITEKEGKCAKGITQSYFDSVPSNMKTLYASEIKDKVKNSYNVMTGDIFEFFTLCFLNYYGNYLKIKDVKSSLFYTADDYGVDAYAVDSVDDFPITIQSKFRSNSSSELTYRELSTFAAASLSGRGKSYLKAPDFSHMILFTSGAGLHYAAKKEFSTNGSMRVFNYSSITKICDGDTTFWNFFNDTLSDTYDDMIGSTTSPIKLRDYQSTIFNKFSHLITDSSSFKMQFILPTGAGKTVIQSEFINSSIQNNCKVFLSVAPTMMLVNQLGQSYHKNINHVRSSFVISSEGMSDDGTCIIENSTNLFDIIEKIIEADVLGIPLILSSTYKSYKKVIHAMELLNKKIDICFLDEAQHAVKKENYDVLVAAIKNKSINNLLSFTATPKGHPADESNTNNIDIASMNNTHVFGEQYVISAKELTDKGYLARPCMNFIELDSDIKNNKDKKRIVSIMDYYYEKINNSIENEVIPYNYDEIMSIVYSLYKHAEKIRSFKNNEIKSKVIISCSSVTRAHMLSCILHDIISMFDYPIFSEEWTIDAISSDPVMMNSFTKIDSRDGILDNFKKENTNGILCHYNVLSEGIDIPACTAVMLLRGMSDILVCQTIGRTVRRTYADSKLQQEIYDTENYKQLYINDPYMWEKPYGHVIIPVYGDNENIKLIVDDILKKIFFDEKYIEGKIEVIQAGNIDVSHEYEKNNHIDLEKIIDDVTDKLGLPDIFKNNYFYYDNIDSEEQVDEIIKMPCVANKTILDIIKEL